MGNDDKPVDLGAPHFQTNLNLAQVCQTAKNSTSATQGSRMNAVSLRTSLGFLHLSSPQYRSRCEWLPGRGFASCVYVDLSKTGYSMVPPLSYVLRWSKIQNGQIFGPTWVLPLAGPISGQTPGVHWSFLLAPLQSCREWWRGLVQRSLLAQWSSCYPPRGCPAGSLRRSAKRCSMERWFPARGGWRKFPAAP